MLSKHIHASCEAASGVLGARRRQHSSLHVALQLFLLVAAIFAPLAAGARTRPVTAARPVLRPHPRAPQLSLPHRAEPTDLTDSSYAKSQVRLVRGAGRMGRLEVSLARELYMRMRGHTSDSGNGGWAPLCDDGAFTQQHAQAFCQILGYRYGRQYFATGISSVGADEVNLPAPVGGLDCGTGTSSTWREWERERHMPLGRIDLSDGVGRSCTVHHSVCPRGLLVGLQCSDSVIYPSVPPPPAPPSPPPPPPPPPNMAHAIRLVPLEFNLRAEDGSDDPPAVYRAELLINASSDGRTGEAVWAPLCARYADVAQYQQDAEEGSGAGFRQLDPVADIACNQFQGSQGTWFESLSGYLRAPILLPDGVAKPGEGEGQEGVWEDVEEAEAEGPAFDPAGYSHWVTVVGGAGSGARSLQEMKMQVSSLPCATGYLYKLACVTTVV